MVTMQTHTQQTSFFYTPRNDDVRVTLKELWKKLDLQDIVGFEASKRFQLQDMRMPLDNASIQRLLTPPVEVERGEWVEFLWCILRIEDV